MLELFEKTFPAFLAQEMADTQLEAENELFRLAVESHALPAQRLRQSAAPIRAISEEIVQDVEGLNAEAVTHFGLGEYAAAAAALSRAIALDLPAAPQGRTASPEAEDLAGGDVGEGLGRQLEVLELVWSALPLGSRGSRSRHGGRSRGSRSRHGGRRCLVDHRLRSLCHSA